MNDEKALLEFCKGKPFDVEELEKVIKEKLTPRKDNRFGTLVDK